MVLSEVRVAMLLSLLMLSASRRCASYPYSNSYSTKRGFAVGGQLIRISNRKSNGHIHRRSASASTFLAAAGGQASRRSKSSTTSSSSSSSSPWSVGDLVDVSSFLSHEKVGRIMEHTGRGWFRVRLSDNSTRSLRTSQLRPLVTSTLTSTISSSSSSSADMDNSNSNNKFVWTAPPPPTMIDLDAQVQALQSHLSYDDNHHYHHRHVQYLRQVENHMSFQKWVVFTDLHCSPSTLETCLRVLQVVRDLALERQAGVVFLGDFWHHRGSLRVECLNAVLEAFRHASWTHVPMVLIPGNHDQATLGGLVHSLTPLENAYRVVAQNNKQQQQQQGSSATTTTTFPGPLIFSHPTKFLNALFVPHIRDVATLESVLQSDMAQMADTQALLVHADVTGASMNDLMVSAGGVSPSAFPADNKHIYSGHFHKPHVVQSAGRTIEYLGSPYEISLAEAHQSKSLVVLDASQGWKCVERIPLTTYHLGRKHYRIESVTDFLKVRVGGGEQGQATTTASTSTTIASTTSLAAVAANNPQEDQTLANGDDDINNISVVVRPGDRVVLSVDRREMIIAREPTKPTAATATVQQVNGQNPNQSSISRSSNGSAILAHATLLRKSGVLVEIREVNTNNSNSSNNGQQPTAGGGADLLQELTPESTLRAFLPLEVARGAMSNDTADVLLRAGLQVLDELENSLPLSSSFSDTSSNESSSSSTANAPQQQQRAGAAVVSSAELVLTEVTVEGFGPFQGRFTYPLANRGLVLLRGINRDGGPDSNGSGKSSLAMASLWCLTGSMDNRPSQDAKVADVVNDNSKVARVTVKGLWNGEEFSVTRSKTATKSGLIFRLNDTDLTTQSPKETQAILDERLGINRQLLARTVFQGQHTNLNGLLEATDTELKDQLSLVVPLSLWQSATSAARKKAGEAKKAASELRGMLSIRSSDRDKTRAVLEQTLEEFAALNQSSTVQRSQLESELARLKEESSAAAHELSAHGTLTLLEEGVEEAAKVVDTLEIEHRSRLDAHRLTVQPIEQQLEEQKELLDSIDVAHEALVRDQIAWTAHVEHAEDIIRRIERTWGLELLSTGVVPESLELPDMCPTCHQPLFASNVPHTHVLGEQAANVASSSSSSGHYQQHGNHNALQESIRDEALTSLKALDHAREKLQDIQDQLDSCQSNTQVARETLALIQSQLDQQMSTWHEYCAELEAKMCAARSSKEEAVSKMTRYARQADESSRIAELQQVLDRITGSWQTSQAAVQKVQEEYTYYESVVEDLQGQLDQQVKVASTMSDLTEVLGPRGGVQTFLLQNAVNLLQSLTQDYLDDLSDGSLRLQLGLEHPGDLRISRKALVRHHQDKDDDFAIGGTDSQPYSSSYRERSLASLSGGQWRRCSLALTFGFADLVSRCSSQQLRSNVLFLDEPLTHLDRSGRAEVGKLLRRLLSQTAAATTGVSGYSSSSHLQVSTIILILQDLAAEELEEDFDCIDVVVRENGSSSVHFSQSS